MTARQRIRGSIILAALLLIVPIVWLLLFHNRSLETAGAVSPLEVSIVNPADLSEWPPGTFVPVMVSIRSDSPVAAIELWADGVLVDHRQPDRNTNPRDGTTMMKWAPAGRGRHLIAAVAQDGDGRRVTSSSLNLSVIDPVPVQYVVGAGDSIELLGRKFAIEPQELIAANPQLGSPEVSAAPGGGLLPGIKLTIPRPHKLLPVSLQNTIQPGTEPPLGQLNTSTQGQTQTSQNQPNTSTQGQTQTSITSQPPGPTGEEADGTKGPPPESSGNLRIENGILILPDSYDLAYVYITVNKTHSDRVPQGSGKFLPGSGSRFDLNKYLDNLIDQFQQTHLDIEMEVWGWQGGSLVEIGNLKFQLDRTVLTVCTKEGEGACGEAPWGGEVILSDYKPLNEQKVDLKWEGADPAQVDRYFIWVASGTNPFGHTDPEPFAGQGIIGEISGWWVNPDETSLTYNLAALYPQGEPVSAGDWEGYGTGKHFSSNWFQSFFPLGGKEPFTISVRVTAYMKDGKTRKDSNVIKIRYKTVQQPEQQTLASDLPPIYDVKIVNYQPPVLPADEKWGCVIVDGAEECPQPWEPPGNWDFESLGQGIWGMVTSGWDWLAKAYEDAKGFVVSNVLAPLIPGGCGDECQANLNQALGYAVTAVTGIPPTLPDFDQLSSDGLTYSLSYAASEWGYECDANCKAVLGPAFKEAIQSAWDNTPAPGCNEDAAHQRRLSPVCVEPGKPWEPSPHSVFQPGVVKVQVTRKADSATVSKEDYKKYRLKLVFKGQNPSRANTWIAFCGYQEGIGDLGTAYTDPGSGYPLSFQVTDPLQGDVSPSQEIVIPWLEPGESISVPVVLNRSEFWAGNHVTYMHWADLNVETHKQYCSDDWLYLYLRGKTEISAALECQNPQGEMVSCSGIADQLTVNNPDTVLGS